MDDFVEAVELTQKSKAIKRRDDYYENSPLTKFFNFESRLFGFIGPYHNRLRQFCEMVGKRKSLKRSTIPNLPTAHYPR